MNYNLNFIAGEDGEATEGSDNSAGVKAAVKKKAPRRDYKDAFRKLAPLLKGEWHFMILALVALLVNSLCTLLGPYFTGIAIDEFVTKGLEGGLAQYSLILLAIYAVAFVGNMVQIRVMGGVGQRLLFKLRNLIFSKLEELPLAFFTQNKAGDLISRINNDTEKLSQFFSETLTRFVGSIFIIVGAAVFLVVVHIKLGVATLLPAVILVILSRLVASSVKKANDEGLKATGLLSAEVQESLQNFKVVVAFNRRDYFRSRFGEINDSNYKSNIKAGIWNGIFMPAYDFAANLGQYAVLAYGLYLIANGQATIGILVSFLAYAEKFYNPLRQMAQLWSAMQVSLSAWARISKILSLESDMKVLAGETVEAGKGIQNVAGEEYAEQNTPLLEFKNVSFHYFDADNKDGSVKEVLDNVSFTLEKGKTYALVGLTGGGKTTTASLMARLFDPSRGSVFLKGKDIRTYEQKDRTLSLGFILQDPVIFGGTLRDNIVYGNPQYEKFTAEEMLATLKDQGLDDLLTRFDGDLNAPLPKNIDSMSLGQKQIIAFIRAVLRKPDLLILDEATANIDTVTEQELEKILQKLPKETTKVVIAHRLNTIQNADVIFFVNGAAVTRAGSMEEAVNMLLKGKKQS